MTMRYVIMPTEVFETADMALARRLGLDRPRRSLDGSEVIMHAECFARLFGPMEAAGRRARRPLAVYEDGEELSELLSSELWTRPEPE